MYTIMVVEDDRTISSLLCNYIEKYGYNAVAVEDFNAILDVFREINPHVILLDLNLPKFDGFYWCRNIRLESPCPIIFMSARTGEMEQVLALESGADDYITKPFYYNVVIAKIKKHLPYSRHNHFGKKNEEHIVSVEKLILYPERPALHFEGKSVSLTKNEALLAEMLMIDYPKVVSRETLEKKIWDNATFIEENTLNVNIARLRKKLKELPMKGSIESVRRMGYRFTFSEEKT